MKSRREVSIPKLAHQFKYGRKALYWIQGLSVSQYGILAGMLGVGMGMAGLYVALQDGKMNLFGSLSVSEAGESRNYMVAGLQNLGNNCFLNVILQALASCSSFLPFLQNMWIVDDQLIEEEAEKMPLLVSLIRIIEELSIVQAEKTTINPRKVMDALGSYVGSFSLTRQQDAAEALLHILCSLELEFLQWYVPHGHSLAEITELPSKICKLKADGERECESWRQHVFGPFDGATGSILTCRTCSSVLSMDFESFRCLSVPVVMARSGSIMDGCTLERCLQQFTTVEDLENYSCSKCWHIAALKYLAQKEGNNEANINRVRNCVNLGSCECQNLFPEEEVLLTGFSQALKQLTIARCPKVLCIHLQRASMNEYGEFSKLQGHISFPFFLDLSPFVKAEMILERESSLGNMQNKRNRPQSSLVNHVSQSNKQQETQALGHSLRSEKDTVILNSISRSKLGESIDDLPGDSSSEVVVEDLGGNAICQDEVVSSNISGCEARPRDEPQFDIKASYAGIMGSKRSYLYSLSSVVEHYGRYGSGHYAVYRRVVANSGDGNFVGSVRSANRQWLYMSDHEVSNVPEESVFAAEASLLFYERLETCL